MTVRIIDRTLYLPRRRGGVIVVPSWERLKALGRRLWHAQLSNAAESNLLALFFTNTAFANVGSTGGLQPSSPSGSIYVAIHTANPGATGTQSTSESAYPGYARVGVVRSGAGWALSGSSPTAAENAAAVTFPQSGSGGSTPETETYFSTGQETSGPGELYWFGALTAPLVVNNLVTPSFAISSLSATLL